MVIKGVKIAKKKDGSCFPLKVTCHHTSDAYGGYGDKIDFCGSELEVEAEGIVKHKWFKYPDNKGTDYGVICPNCGMFTTIPDGYIPMAVREKAPDVSLENGRLRGFKADEQGE